jgi:hypothetical protein
VCRPHPLAAGSGALPYYSHDDPEELASAIDIKLRRAVIEQATGIPMARHAVNGDKAEMLRSHSQHNGRKVVDVAEAVVESHLLLLPPLPQPPARAGTAGFAATSE